MLGMNVVLFGAMHLSARIFLVCLLLAPAAPLTFAQTKPPVSSIASHPDWPKAKAADVHSVDAILAALYDVISGPAGQPRDWDRFRSLFVPDARLIPVRHAKSGNGADVLPLTPDRYIELSSHALSEGFFEHSVHNTVNSFGDIVDVFSTYESRHAKADAKPFARGINSIQLLKDGDRYWLVTILWDQERPGAQIPAQYLP
jgi:hypothetical protein